MFLRFMNCFPKQFFCVLVLMICISGFLHVWYLNHVLTFADDITSLADRARRRSENFEHVKKKIQSALFWYSVGALENQTLQCKYPGYHCAFKVRDNCTDNEDIYDGQIIFDERILNSTDWPKTRFLNQLYIFWSLQSATNAPACTKHFDNFFNWSITYRLDSTFVWSPFIVRDLKSKTVVAPNKSVIWMENHDDLRPDVKRILNMKKKPLALILPNCKSNHARDLYIVDLQEQMLYLELFIDIYGPCTNYNCPNNDCNEMIKSDYYFYMAFEDSFAKDYVSDNILHAYNNYAVPVVYGGANYSWFLPPGSYLNAVEMSPYSVAFAMKEAVANAGVYEGYFNWTNVYSIGVHPDGKHPLCHLCSALHKHGQETYTIKNFTQWWNTPEGIKSCNNSKLS